MLEGKMVKVRFRKYFVEQRLWVFLGKVLMMDNWWLRIEGKGIVIFKGQPPQIDEKERIILVPRDNIAHIRILPDDFDLSRIKVEAGKFALRNYVKVKGGPDTSIGEI